MVFLKEILGEELYAQFEQAVNAWNGNEANKEKQIKLANLATGDYVGKGKYSSLEAENQTNATKLTEANNLIAQLQKAAKGDEALQGQVTAYQTRVQELETELEKTKLENAIKFELLSAKAIEPDYLIYKMKANGEELKLDENGKIKGWEEKLAGLKTQFPAQFEPSGSPKVIERKLPGGDPGPVTVTKEQFRSMSFEDRMNLKKSNEELYKQYAKN